MRADETRLQIAFDQWVNRRLLDTAEALTEAQYLSGVAPTNWPLHASLVHLIDTEWGYRLILSGTGDADQAAMQPEDFATLASLRTRWDEEDAAMTAWAASLADDDLDGTIVLGDGIPPLRRWTILHHMLMHSRQLQADVATILSGYGHSPGDLDFFDFLQEWAARDDAQ